MGFRVDLVLRRLREMTAWEFVHVLLMQLHWLVSSRVRWLSPWVYSYHFWVQWFPWLLRSTRSSWFIRLRMFHSRFFCWTPVVSAPPAAVLHRVWMRCRPHCSLLVAQLLVSQSADGLPYLSAFGMQEASLEIPTVLAGDVWSSQLFPVGQLSRLSPVSLVLRAISLRESRSLTSLLSSRLVWAIWWGRGRGGELEKDGSQLAYSVSFAILLTLRLESLHFFLEFVVLLCYQPLLS